MQLQRGKKYLSYTTILILVGSVFSIVAPIFQPSAASHENITVNIALDEITDVYDPGDSVTIEGMIDDVLENEEVIFKVGEPGDATPNQEHTDEPSSNGGFDYAFDIPDSADDGVWTMEVEYDDESAFTYFIADDVSDTIDVELDKTTSIYEAGDEVTISGTVEDVDSTVNEVEITVLDPTHNEIADELDVDLNDDEFEYSFDLENDASHGRYAVIVTYNFNNQEGSILFEIEDEEASTGTGNGDSDTDGDLSAEIEEATYAPGDAVSISGTIDNYNSADNEDLEIIVQDPDEVEIESDDNVDVETDGDFGFEFDLADNAPQGDYTVTIAYDTDEVELTFTVEESSTGGSTTSALTAKLNKASYLAGDTMIVTGKVPKRVQDETVNIVVFKPDGTFAGSVAYVEPNSDLTYSATLELKDTLAVAEEYKVIASYNEQDVEIIFAITGQAPPETLSPITIKTDKQQYAAGATIIVSGKVSDIIEGQKLFLEVFNPLEEAYRFDQVTPASDGSYSYSLVVGGKLGVSGEYEVIGTYNEKQAKTTFVLTGGTTGKPTYPVKVEDRSYPVEYDLSGATIKNMFIKVSDKKLVISIDATQNGQLVLVLPRDIIDAVESGEDVQYVVGTTDLESGTGGAVDIRESETTNETRTIVIDFEQGTDLIEISGTSVVPEFGPLAASILATAIVGMIVASARFQNKSSFFFRKG